MKKPMLLAMGVMAYSMQASALTIDGNVVTMGVSLNNQSNLLITNTGGIDTAFLAGETAAFLESGNTINFITNNGQIFMTGDGIYIEDGAVVNDAIINRGSIESISLYQGAQAWGGGIAVDGTVGGGIINNGTITLTPTACEDPVCVSGSGIGVFGPAVVTGGIVNGPNGDIEANAFNGSFAAGIQLLGVIDPDGNSLGSPTVNGNIVNRGQIVAQGNGIDIAGGTVNGDIFNAAGAELEGDSGIFISDGAARVDVAQDLVTEFVGDDDNETGPIATTINGSIINGGIITGNGTDGITFKGDVTIVGDVINGSGAVISALEGDGVGAIYSEGGGVRVNRIVNAGVLSVAQGGIDQEDGVNYLSNPDHSTIVVGDGDTFNQVVNQSGGNIINNGYISGGYAIAVRGTGSLGIVDNSGTILGAVDFGSAGGTYTFRGGSVQYGSIMNATTIRLANDGLINPNGLAASQFIGNLTHNGGLWVDVRGSQTGITSGFLQVEGNVNLSGASVNFNVSGDQFIAPGDVIDVVAVNGNLNTNGVTVTDNSAILNFSVEQTEVDIDFGAAFGEDEELAATFQVLQAVVRPADIGTIGQDLGLNPRKPGFRNIDRVGAAVFDDLPPLLGNGVPEGSRLGELYNRLIAISDEEELIAAVATLDPETVEGSSTGAMSADTAAAGTVNNRMAALRGEYGISGATAGDPLSINGWWIQAYDNETDQDTRDLVDGFDADTYGIAVGFDTIVNDQVSAGLAFSYSDTDVENKLSGNELLIGSYRLTAYGSYSADTYYVDGQLAYSYNDYESERTLFSGDVAEGDHNGDQYTLRLRTGYPFAYENGIFLTPIASMDYTYLIEDEYSETGAGNAGLEIDMDEVEALILSLGVKVAYAFTTDNEFTWVPELSIEAMRDVIGDEVEIDSNFIGVSGAAFITQGANNEQEMYKAGLKLRAFGQGNMSFSVGYDYIEKQDYDSQSFVATIRYDF